MDATRLWRLEGVVQPYAWGSKTAIPELLGVEPTGEPQAELWLGAHPSAPSIILADGERVPLDAWIRADPVGVLGTEVAAEFDGELPFLLKVLAAEEPLSIQAHPNAEQAREGFAREERAGIPRDAPNRCYRDPHPKPELIVALTPFRALCRFRAPGDIAVRFEALGIDALTALAKPLRRSPDRTGLRAFFERWMMLDAQRRCRLVEEAAASVDPAGDPAHAMLAELARSYPGDPGVLAPLFLNLVELAPGEAMYLPAGELHAYLGGLAIEVMASSDNVLRGGLTPKHVDVPELLAVLGFDSGSPKIQWPEPVGPVEVRYATPAREFSLSVLRPSEEQAWDSPARRGLEILFCTEGVARLFASDDPPLVLQPGQGVLAPAAAGAYRAEGDRAVLHRLGVAVK
ncbi:MAG: mannose-6-phosphate isomerase, class I [Myxococcota bacterium]